MESKMKDLELIIEEMQDNQERMKEEHHKKMVELTEKLATAKIEIFDEKAK